MVINYLVYLWYKKQINMATYIPTVATDILNQLGGNKFIAMTGSKNFLSTENSLQMTLTTNKLKAKYMTVKLNSLDLYDVTFTTLKKTLNKELAALGVKIYDEKLVEISTCNNIYAEDLATLFTKETGLLTRL